MAAMAAVYFLYGLSPFLFAYDHWIGLCTASLLMSLIQVSRCFSGFRFVQATALLTFCLHLSLGNILLCRVLRARHHASHWR